MGRTKKIMDYAGVGWLIPGTVMFLLLLFTCTCKRFEADQLVVIETGSVSDITHSSCTVTGEVYDAGAGGIDQHGFVWSLQRDPQIDGGNKSELGSRDNTGSFTGSVSGLAPDTIYYLKAYGTAGQETTYGKEVTFATTAPTVPVVTTAQVTAITDTTAVSGGEITGDGGSEIMARGVCWDTVASPTTKNSLTTDGSGTGTFSSLVRHLKPATTYYLRAYATNSVGTGYGEEQEFTTGLPQPEFPVVSTGDVTSITENSAWCGGNITDDGGSDITVRGLCWSTFQDPTLLDDHTEDGSGTGEFSRLLTDLSCNTTYFVRAYATNGLGVAYGDQKEFQTLTCPVFLPEVTTVAANDISDSAAVSGGNVVDDGGGTIIARGVCWNTQPNPTPEDNHTEDGTGPGTFTSSMTGLEHLTTYYYKAYATNEIGTVYGDEFEFTTLDLHGHVTDIDRNSYPVVTIGTQVWMAENLKVLHYSDGSPIQLVEDQTTWGNLTRSDKAVCYYSYNPAYGEDYGGLYTWAGAMNGEPASELSPSGVQGACPAGWHLPSDEEWKELEMYLGMTREQADSIGYRGEGYGGKLKAEGTEFWQDPNEGANNETGFSALPGGYMNLTGWNMARTQYSYFWSATETGDKETWYRSLRYNSTLIYREANYFTEEGYSVRCVQDN